MSGLSGYDAWLEAPYVNASRYEAAYEAWCEEQGLDPSDDNYEAFDEAQEELMEPDPDDERDRREDR